MVQPNGIPTAVYAPPISAPRTSGVAVGMVAGATMAMSAGKPPVPPTHDFMFLMAKLHLQKNMFSILFPAEGALLTAHSPAAVAPHAVTIPPYRAAGTPTYSYVPPPMVNSWQCE